ncbi:MAG: CRISPR-associated protein Cas4 [Dehalococcoidia bacterium]|nr:CRISPR-associated protein Cas4 [Dehalococcoidia bacterium]
MAQEAETKPDLPEAGFEALRTNGVKVNYFFICQRKLWLYSKNLTMESGSDQVTLGRLLHDRAYRYLPKREIMVDNMIRIDSLEGSVIHEVKYSRKMEDAHRWQILYYLYYLKQLGIDGLEGEINYPKLRRKEEVTLDNEAEAKIPQILREIKQIENLPEPPEASFSRMCKKCSYAELCWG